MDLLGQGNTLSKEERLYCRKDISGLLAGGKFLSVGILRFCHKPNGLPYSRILVSVPKRNFKRAVKRNLLKRRIRESYRLQKGLLKTGHDIMIVYTSKEIVPFDVIKDSIGKFLSKIEDGNN